MCEMPFFKCMAKGFRLRWRPPFPRSRPRPYPFHFLCLPRLAFPVTTAVGKAIKTRCQALSSNSNSNRNPKTKGFKANRNMLLFQKAKPVHYALHHSEQKHVPIPEGLRPRTFTPAGT